MTAGTWSKEPPKEPGWYWWRMSSSGSCSPIGWSCSGRIDYFSPDDPSFWRTRSWPKIGEWYSIPIHPPDEEA